MSDAVEPSVSDDLEIDGDAMVAEIASHLSAEPTLAAASTLVNPPVEVTELEQGVGAEPVAQAAPAVAPDVSTLLLQQLAASQDLNAKMLAAIERIGQPAAAALASEDPFAGLDPDDPDDKLEIANRKVDILERRMETFAQAVTADRARAATAQAIAHNSSRLASEVEAFASKMGVTEREHKAVLFDLASQAWGQAGFSPGHFRAAQEALRSVENLYGHARRTAQVRAPRTDREPIAPVRGAAGGTLPPVPSASESRWKTANIYNIDEMAELFAADLSGPH